MAAITRSAAFIPSSSARYGQGVAGAAIAEGDPLYIDTANNNVLKPADANLSLLAATVVGLAQHSASTGQSVNYVTEDTGGCQIGATLLVGDTLWSSATAGGITVTAADNTTGVYVCSLGVMMTTTLANIKICNSGAIHV